MDMCKLIKINLGEVFFQVKKAGLETCFEERET